MKRKKILLVVFLVIIVIAIVFIGMNIRIKHMESVVERDVIYEGIYIDDIHMGGLLKEDAMALLKEKIENENMKKLLKVNIDHKTNYLIPFYYFEQRIDYIVPVESAYQIGREGTLKQRYKEIQDLKEKNIKLFTSEGLNDRRIKDFVTLIKTKQDVLPQDAKIKREKGLFVIQNEVVGKEILIDESINRIQKSISLDQEQVELEFIKKEPKIIKAMYEDIKEVVGSYHTSFSASQYGRNENLRVACSLINNTILFPGEVFSTNKKIGPVNAANGYKEAPIILNGKIQPGIGGGVCQISTTLYNAVLLAELEVVERQNHSMPVGYIEKGRDATLAGDFIDFKFKNNTKVPIYIESYIKDYKIYMNIYSKESREKNRKVEFESTIINKIMPPPEKITMDPNLQVGEEIVEKKSAIGYTVKLYKKIYIDGILVEKQTINTSNYRAVAAEIRRGSATLPTMNVLEEMNKNLDETNPVDETNPIDEINELDVPFDF